MSTQKGALAIAIAMMVCTGACAAPTAEEEEVGDSDLAATADKESADATTLKGCEATHLVPVDADVTVKFTLTPGQGRTFFISSPSTASTKTRIGLAEGTRWLRPDSAGAIYANAWLPKTATEPKEFTLRIDRGTGRSVSWSSNCISTGPIENGRRRFTSVTNTSGFPVKLVKTAMETLASSSSTTRRSRDR